MWPWTQVPRYRCVMSLYDDLAAAYEELFPPNPEQAAFIRSLAEGAFGSTGSAAAGPGGAAAAAPAGSAARRAPRLIDLGCATGSLLRELAAEGWDCLGLEPSTAMLEEARRLAAGLARPPRFESGGMLQVADFGAGAWDFVACLGNTLPHLASEAELERFFVLARQALLPGGRLVLQLLNYAVPGVGPGMVFPELRVGVRSAEAAGAESAAGGLVFRRAYAAGPEGSILFRTELASPASPDRPVRDEQRLLPFVPARIRRGLAEAGLALREERASWGRPGFDEGRDRFVILVAERPA